MTTSTSGGETRFRLSTEAWSAHARRMNRRALVLVGATAAVVIAIWAGVLRDRGAGPGSLLLPLGLLVAFAGLSHLSRMRRSRGRWEGFLISLEPDAIRRELPGFPTVTLARREIASVEEGPRGVAIRAGDGALLVPRELEGYERFRAALAAWRSGTA
jgi:hypothetical protein